MSFVWCIGTTELDLVWPVLHGFLSPCGGVRPKRGRRGEEANDGVRRAKADEIDRDERIDAGGDHALRRGIEGQAADVALFDLELA